MSQHDMEQRIATVETNVAVLQRDVTRMDINIVGIDAGVKKLLEREAGRPEPMSYSKVGATVISMVIIVGALWGFVTWLVDHSPTVQAHERRLTKIDDKEDGRLPRIENRLRLIEGWQPKVVRH